MLDGGCGRTTAAGSHSSTYHSAENTLMAAAGQGTHDDRCVTRVAIQPASCGNARNNAVPMIASMRKA